MNPGITGSLGGLFKMVSLLPKLITHLSNKAHCLLHQFLLTFGGAASLL
jgi:hypothetical protein